MSEHKVTVHLDDRIPSNIQAEALLAFERILRVQSGLDVRVFKERMGDDSKLRVKMTLKQRNNL